MRVNPTSPYPWHHHAALPGPRTPCRRFAPVGLRSCCSLAVGTPEKVAKAKGSITGKYLAPYLK